MKLKIIHRSSSIWNIIVFVLLSFFFLFVESAILENKSGLDHEFLKSFILSEKTLMIGMMVTSFAIYFHSRVSKICFFLYSSLIVINVGMDLYQDFDKFIIAMLFFFILSSYYFYLLLVTELKKAYLCPNYSTRELFDPMLYKITCRVDELALSGDSAGYLLNWDNESCFVAYEWKDLPKDKNINFTVEYDEYKFTQKAKIVSFKKNIGFGVVFTDQESESLFNWVEFNKIINDLGFTVGYLK
jgi:hypothetical protein